MSSLLLLHHEGGELGWWVLSWPALDITSFAFGSGTSRPQTAAEPVSSMLALGETLGNDPVSAAPGAGAPQTLPDPQSWDL